MKNKLISRKKKQIFFYNWHKKLRMRQIPITRGHFLHCIGPSKIGFSFDIKRPSQKKQKINSKGAEHDTAHYFQKDMDCAKMQKSNFETQLVIIKRGQPQKVFVVSYFSTKSLRDYKNRIIQIGLNNRKDKRLPSTQRSQKRSWLEIRPQACDIKKPDQRSF